MIEHTVTFRLQYAAGSPADTAFLAAARELATMPGVRDFAIRRQVSPRCDNTLGIAMRFTDQDAYDHSNAHLRHVAFVRDRWTPDVASVNAG